MREKFCDIPVRFNLSSLRSIRVDVCFGKIDRLRFSHKELEKGFCPRGGDGIILIGFNGSGECRNSLRSCESKRVESLAILYINAFTSLLLNTFTIFFRKTETRQACRTQQVSYDVSSNASLDRVIWLYFIC